MNFLSLAGFLIFAIGGLWGSIASFGFLADKIGFFWALVSMILAPVSLTISAIWAGASEGNWSILAIGVTSTVVGLGLVGIGSRNSGQ